MADVIPKVTSSVGNEKTGKEIKRKRKANLYIMGS
jgi:hypothetical protein